VQPVRGPKRWLGLLVVGIILFAGGGGTGYLLGQQQAKAQQTSQLKNAPKGMTGKRPSKPGNAPSNDSSSN